MDMRTGTIGGAQSAGIWSVPSAAGQARTKTASFAMQMAALTDSVTLSDPAGDPTLRAAYEQLTDSSKEVLERIKNGQSGVTQEEWTQLCRELKDAGMITESDFAFSRADLRAVPIMTDGTKDGCTVVNGGGDFPLLSWIEGQEWSGDPLKFLDEWIAQLRDQHTRAAAERLADGTQPVQYMNALAGCMSSCEKVSGLVKDLMKVC